MGEVARVYPLNRQQPEPLWREVLGGRLRVLRAGRKETLAETAERAGVSPQYLSEVERGRKEPSSEMIAALAGALDTTLADLTTQVTEDLRHSRGARSDRGARVPRASSAPSAPVAPCGPDAPGAPGAPVAPVALALAA
jgi:transcriptional regulator with XRE-family HTH domain